MADAYQRERERLEFLENRDGERKALGFAKEKLHIYRRLLAHRDKNGNKTGLGVTFRREFVVSCIVFRDYIRTATRNREELARRTWLMSEAMRDGLGRDWDPGGR
jgi:hypothetical protein